MDKVHGNCFIYNLFGPNENQRHNNFKTFFACQNHLIKPPPLKKSVLEGTASSYVNVIYISTYLDACCHLLHRWNEHKFQRSPYGQKMMTHKEKRDGLQTYSLCQKGYTYQICMCNDPPQKTYLYKMMLPLHTSDVSFWYWGGKKTPMRNGWSLQPSRLFQGSVHIYQHLLFYYYICWCSSCVGISI